MPVLLIPTVLGQQEVEAMVPGSSPHDSLQQTLQLEGAEVAVFP